MGMYTGLRFKGYVKPEYRERFAQVALDGDWESFEDVVVFNKSRASFIPRGVLCYMPNAWDRYKNGFERSYDVDTGYWTFQCSLKNYEGEIERFFYLLPIFIEKIEHCEYYYEEWRWSESYDLVDGKVQCVEPHFIDYGDELPEED